MDRHRLYDYIVSNNLKDAVKAKYGTPYNSTSTDKLAEFVTAHQSKANTSKVEPEKIKTTVTPKVESLDRNACFKIIKEQNWQTEVRDKYGKPYSSVSTENLNEFINSKNEVPDTKESHNVVRKDTSKNEPFHEERGNTSSCIDSGARKAITAICELLNIKDILRNFD